MSGQPYVYVSSTFEDLRTERERVLKVVAAQEAAPLAMEYYGARDQDALSKCVADVKRSQVFVGIIGWREGSRPPGSTQSFAEHEFDAATSAGIPRLMYFVSSTSRSGAGNVGTLSYRDRVSKSGLMCRTFDTEADLATFVATDLSRELELIRGKSGPQPRFLPYLCDRVPQTSAIIDEVATPAEQGPPVCFVYGSSDQAPLSFLDCLQRVHLPDLTRVERGRTREIALDWPGGERLPVARQVQVGLATALKLKVLQEESELEKQIRTAVVEHDGPVLITLQAPHEQSTGSRTAALESIVGYFAAWPAVPPRKPDLIVICVDYPVYTPTFWGALGLSPEKRRRDKLRAFARALDKAGSIRVLPELANVQKADALTWTRRDELLHLRTQLDLEQGISKIYGVKDSLPMADLAPQLSELLTAPTGRRQP